MKTYITHEDEIKHRQYVAFKTIMQQHEITQAKEEAKLIGITANAWVQRCDRKLLNMTIDELGRVAKALELTYQEVYYIVRGSK